MKFDKTYHGTINPQDQYNGLNNLKKAGVKIEMTPEQAQEFYKCSQDFEYFLENYVEILSLDMGTVPFVPFGYQRRAMKKIVGNRFSILRWPRQMGKTTTVAAVLLWYAIFNKKYNIYVLAQQRGQAMEILDRIKEMYECLPWWFQPGIHTWNKGSVQLGNKSKIVTAATGGSGVRGKSVNLLYLDEFAWVDNDHEFYTATYPVVSSGDTSKIIITSTPNGMNLFYKLWTEAIRGDNNYVWDDALWHEHPKRDKAWYDEQMANMSERQFNQEFMCEFQGSSDTLLSPATLQRLVFQNPIRLLGDNKEFKIYADPEPGHFYVLTVDVSEGVGKDYSVVSVIDVTQAPYKQVAMMRSNIMSPLLLADLVDKTGKKYNDAYVIVESNTYGKQVVDALWMDYEYENMLLSRGGNNDAKISGARNERIAPGVKTTKKTKQIGCSTLKGLIESNQLIINDYETIEELNSFSKKGTSYEAEKGKYDDVVMSLVIFAWFSAQPYFEDTFDQNTRDLVRQNILQDAEYHTAFGFMDDGTGDDFDFGFGKQSEELFESFH
ncbi:terminase large subunit [Xanthomonas phage BUDD]|nr:terminase large subunit [Xanthomonas phage BUDD]